MEDNNYPIAEYDLEYMMETEDALSVKYSDDTIWLPKSQITYNIKSYRHGDVIIVQIPDWLAEDKGLI